MNKYVKKIASLIAEVAESVSIVKEATRRWPATLGYAVAGSVVGAGLGYVRAKSEKLNKKDTKGHVIGNALTLGALGAFAHRSGLKTKLETHKFMRDKRRMNAGVNELYKQYRSKLKFKAKVGPIHRDLKAFGVDVNRFRTKKEAEKHFKTHLHRAHPDKHQGNTERFQKLSTARDRLLNSDWFDKLAAKQSKVKKVMHEYKHNELHSGSKHGPKVKSRKQAIAIALSEQRQAEKKANIFIERIGEDFVSGEAEFIPLKDFENKYLSKIASAKTQRVIEDNNNAIATAPKVNTKFFTRMKLRGI